jgi:hypothetical protein
MLYSDAFPRGNYNGGVRFANGGNSFFGCPNNAVAGRTAPYITEVELPIIDTHDFNDMRWFAY